MATVWNGETMVENVSDKDAKKMVDNDEGQWLEQHDGSAFKHRDEFTGYSNKAMATKVSKEPAPVKKKAPAKKKPAKKD